MSEPSSPDTRGPIVEFVHLNRERFTPEAMRDELLSAGYEASEIEAVLSAKGTARPADEPASGVAAEHPRLVAAGVVVAAYGAIWLLFALVTDWTRYYTAFTTQILAAVLGLFGVISLIYVANTGRLSAGGRAAIGAALTGPLILLLILGGLCVPFTTFR